MKGTLKIKPLKPLFGSAGHVAGTGIGTRACFLCRRFLRCCILCCGCWFVLLSCSDDGRGTGLPNGAGTEVGTPQAPHSFVLTYTIPDTEEQPNMTRAVTQTMPSANTRTATYLAPVPIANADESKVSGLKLLFFERDDFGNGTYVGMLDGNKASPSIEKTDKVTVSVGTSTKIDASLDYNVLVIANSQNYISDDDLEKSCQNKTENRVKMQLRAEMPELTGDAGYFRIPSEGLLMSGTCIKRAGSDLFVELIRAAVRIDVKVADDKQDEIVLVEATLRNVSPRIPLFSDPIDAPFTPLAFKDLVTPFPEATNDTVIRGGLYLSEVFRTGLEDATLRSSQSACLLVNCHKISYSGPRTWYRVDIRIEDDGSQYLKRNNAYTVVISNIKSLGAESPEEAYQSDATLIKTVTIPTDWQTPDGITTPPIVNIE